jgi:hypothetical protein
MATIIDPEKQKQAKQYARKKHGMPDSIVMEKYYALRPELENSSWAITLTK